MRKFYKKFFRFALFVTFLLPFLTAKGQIDFPIGTGNTGNANTTYPCPMQDFYEGSRMQYLYLASELTALGMKAGNINSI